MGASRRRHPVAALQARAASLGGHQGGARRPLRGRSKGPGRRAMTLILESVEKRVDGDLHIAELSLALEPGAVNVLLGPTGAGKTSLMRLMAGLDRPTAGGVLVDGRDVTGLGVRRRNVAMVYQQFVNYPSLSVYDNIASPLRMAGKLDRAEIDRRVRTTAH